MPYALSDLMQLILSEEGDALHLHEGEPPVVEIGGQLHRVEGPPLEPDEARDMFQGIAPPEESREIVNNGLASFEFRHKNGVFRLMALREEGSIRLELRVVSQ